MKDRVNAANEKIPIVKQMERKVIPIEELEKYNDWTVLKIIESTSESLKCRRCGRSPGRYAQCYYDSGGHSISHDFMVVKNTIHQAILERKSTN